ncbi:hypothetical protein SBA2_170023 [Acidobacteriia bacterium SbA2]|nr:hypothetical protein SBA2_170023 [Acidobacteriia bacterium SbA2]
MDSRPRGKDCAHEVSWADNERRRPRLSSGRSLGAPRTSPEPQERRPPHHGSVGASRGARGVTELPEFLAGQLRLVGIRTLLDQGTQFFGPRALLPKLKQRKALLELRGRGLVAPLFNALIVLRDRVVIFLLGGVNLPDIELGVRSPVRLAVILQVLQKSLNGKVVLPPVVVRQAGVIEAVRVRNTRLRGRRLGARRAWGPGIRRARGSACRLLRGSRNRLDNILRLRQLLPQLADARLGFIEALAERLDLGGHGIEARGGGGQVFLLGAAQIVHIGFDRVDIVAGMFDQSLQDIVLRLYGLLEVGHSLLQRFKLLHHPKRLFADREEGLRSGKQKAKSKNQYGMLFQGESPSLFKVNTRQCTLPSIFGSTGASKRTSL